MNVENLNKLIARLETQQSSKFDMRNFYVQNGRAVPASSTVGSLHECGTAACIAGHICEMNGKALGQDGASDWLGFACYNRSDELFCPEGYWREEAVGRYSLERAIATLKRLRDTYLSTGQVVVDWGPEPGEEPKTPWVAPHVSEVIAPTLPAEITSLLRPSLAKTEA